MSRRRFTEMLLEGLVEATNSSALDSWDTLRRILSPLTSLNEIASILVYREHRGDLTMLGQVGSVGAGFRSNVFDPAEVSEQRAEVCEFQAKGRRVSGLLVIVPEPGCSLDRLMVHRLARVVGRVLGGGRISRPREERIERSLRGVLEQLVSLPNPVDALRPLLLEMIAQVDSNGGGLFVYNSSSNTLQMVELVSYRRAPSDLLQQEFDSFSHPVPADITPYWKRLLDERGPVLLDATQDCDDQYFWPGTRQWHLSQNEPLAVGFPLILGDRPLGFIGLTFALDADVGPSMLEAAAPFSHEATLALGLIELGERARETVRQTQNEELIRMNHTIEQGLGVLEGELEQQGVVGNLLRVVSEHLDCQSSALWLYCEETDSFEVVLVLMDGEVVSDVARIAPVWPYGRNMYWRRHIEERRPVVYTVSELEPKAEQTFFDNLGIKTLLGIPLLCGRDVVGAFTMRFTEARAFTSSNLQLVQILSHQATLAILITRWIEKAKKLAVTAERTRLAGEIHDTVGQDLAALLAHSRAAQGCLSGPTANFHKAAEHLRKVEKLARKGLLETRRSLENLHPLALERSSLRRALEKHLTRLARSGGLECRFSCVGFHKQLPKAVEAELYRIIQEGINNAVIHSGASTLSLTMEYSKHGLSLELADDAGDTDHSLDSSGHGLSLIRTRAARVGAEVDYQHRPGQGTVLRVKWESRA